MAIAVWLNIVLDGYLTAFTTVRWWWAFSTSFEKYQASNTFL